MGCGCHKTPEQILAERMQRLAENEAKRMQRLGLVPKDSSSVSVNPVHPLAPDQIGSDR